MRKRAILIAAACLLMHGRGAALAGELTLYEQCERKSAELRDKVSVVLKSGETDEAKRKAGGACAEFVGWCDKNGLIASGYAAAREGLKHDPDNKKLTRYLETIKKKVNLTDELWDRFVALSYPFKGIASHILMEPFNPGSPGTVRKMAFKEFEEYLWKKVPNAFGGNTRENEDRLIQFYNVMIDKAVLEMETEKVEKGVTVWAIYSMGYIVKTPKSMFSFDLVDLSRSHPGLRRMIPQLDAAFVSHSHGDHDGGQPKGEKRIDWMHEAGGPFKKGGLTYHVLPGWQAGHEPFKGPAPKGNTWAERAIKEGKKGVPDNLYEVITDNGVVLYHIGDNTAATPVSKSPSVDISFGPTYPNMPVLRGKVGIGSHRYELGHAVSNWRLKGEPETTMLWGERFHYKK